MFIFVIALLLALVMFLLGGIDHVNSIDLNCLSCRFPSILDSRWC